MKDNTFTLSVDIKKSNYLDEPTVTQNDEITFILQVTDDGEPFDLTEVSTFTLVSMRPDKQSIQTLGIKTGANEATFNLGTSELAVPGRISAAIQLYDADGRVSSIPFSYRVLPDLAEGYIPSQNEQTLIELVLGQGPAILAAAQQATANIESLGFISEYDPLITYKKNNIVSYQGGSYIAKSDTTGNLPTDTIHWGKVAEKGEQGIQGMPGEQGIQGPKGDKGEQGVPGQNGTGSGTVTSVNGSQPDVAGNVELIIPNPDLTSLTTKTEFVEHKAEKVHLGEVHGMRANTGKFEYFNGTSWVQVEGGGSDVKPSKVVDLMGVTAVDGKKATLTWKNPTNTEFVRTEIYASAIDITNLDIASVISNSTKIVSSKTLVTSDYPTVHGNLNYFKAYAVHTILGSELYSDGVTVSVLSQDTKPPAIVTSFTAKAGNATTTLSWVNPVDADFAKVVIRYSDSGFPNDPTTAGTLAYEGSGTTANLTGLVNGTTYNFRAFTFDTVGNINNDVGQVVSATPAEFKIYGVKIDTLNSNPETAVTYTDDAIGMTGGSVAWDTLYPFNEMRPVLYNAGAVVSELDKNDFSKTKLGGVADITSGTTGDVMIEIPRVWWKFETIGTDLFVKYADKQVDSSWKAWGHTRGTTIKDYCYIGAYLGFNSGGKLRSLSGKNPTASQRIGGFRTLAQANGVGYDQIAYYQLLMLQVLFLVRYKNRDSQTALGRGYVDGNNAGIATGGTNIKGMNFGESTGKQQMKFAGVEDFWGNLYYWIDGFYCNATRNMLIGTKDFNDTGSGYADYGQASTINLNGYLTQVQGGTETGFTPKDVSGSASTYYADATPLDASCVAVFGGFYAEGSPPGAFRLRAISAPSIFDPVFSSRLMYL